MKVKFSKTDEDISQISPIEYKAQTEAIAVPPDAIKKFNVTDTSVIKTGQLRWTMKPSIEMSGVTGLRVQDEVVRDIVQNNTWDRPIYFASTCSPDCFIGLDDYLQVEGLASRLVLKGRQPRFMKMLNFRWKSLSENPGYSKTFKPGFKLEG